MKFKKVLAIVLSVVMLLSAIPFSAAAAQTEEIAQTSANSTYSTALNVSPNSSGRYVFNNFDYSNCDLWMKFTLTSRGVLEFDCTKLCDSTGKLDSVYFYLYKSPDVGTNVWADTSYRYETIVGDMYNFDIPLDKGTYYLLLDTSLSNKYRVLDYKFKFTPNSYYEVEPNGGVSTATPIALDKTYTGYNDGSDDYYSITVSKNTKVRFKVTNLEELKERSSIYVKLADGTTEYYGSYNTVKSSNCSYIDVLLLKGTNYLYVSSSYKRPVIKYSIQASTSIAYSAPVIKSIEKDTYSTTSKYYDVQIKWNARTGVDGYEVYYRTTSGSWKLCSDIKTNAEGIRIWNLEKAKSYQVRVRSYKLFGGSKHYSSWSKVTNLYNTPKNIKLSATKYTYSGKKVTPSITIKDSMGNKLTKDKHYTLTFSSSSRKNVGKYTVTIKFKGGYAGEVKKSFTIYPKGTSVSSVSAGKSALTVKVKSQKTQTTGYQVQASTSSKFTSPKTVSIKNSTTTAKLTGLSAKKTYYVRTRTYKTINGVKYYSSWSKAVKKATK